MRRGRFELRVWGDSPGEINGHEERKIRGDDVLGDRRCTYVNNLPFLCLQN